MTKDEALKQALDDLILEYHMETSSFAKRVDEIFEQALAAPVQEPVATVTSESGNPDVTMSWWHEPPLPVGTKLYTTPPAAPVQEPVAHQIIAGALFDFMGFLTSRNERLMLSSADNASPAVEAITNFAKMRGLSLDDARVEDWQDTTPPAAQPAVPDALTSADIEEHIEYVAGWNDCRAAMLEMMK